MENERTYEQWEQEIKETVADAGTKAVLTTAEIVVADLMKSLIAMRIALEVPNSPEGIDEEALKMLLRDTGRIAVIADVLQLHFGDAAEHEMELLSQMQEIFGE